MHPQQRDYLRTLLVERALRLGSFTLASGRHSDYYLDLKAVLLGHATAPLIAAALYDVVADWLPWDRHETLAVGGLETAAAPLAALVCCQARSCGARLDGFWVRKQPRDHGTGQSIEGTFARGAAVVVLEDVLTTGQSALRAVRAVEEAGGHVKGVAAVVDRLEGARQLLEEHLLQVRSVFTIADLLPPTKE